MVEAAVLPVSIEEKNAHDGGSLYPMYFGASCAFMALHLLPKARAPDLDAARRHRLGGMLLQGSAHLLGLLFWEAQRGGEALGESLRRAGSEVEELKRLRVEDARANEKVVGIFAAHEQSWIAEKKKLRLQIQALLAQFQVLEARKEETISDLSSRMEEQEQVILSKDEALEEEAKKGAELEEKLRAAEAAAEEALERAEKEAQDHAAELWKHKTAFAELVSSQRQLEAELGRALRQAEAAKKELDEALEKKEEAVAVVEKLSEDAVKMRKDGEQKDKILSAMLRKSKLDTAEKQMLLKEVRMAKARRKQAELEVERLRDLCGPRRRRDAEGSHPGGSGFHSRTLLLDYLDTASNKESDCDTPEGDDIVACDGVLSLCSTKDDDGDDDEEEEGEGEELVTTDIRHLQEWVRSETEKYASMLEQRHCAEIEAFTEQLQLKDEKLEAYRWRLLSMELEAKRLQSHIEGLDGNLSKFREESIKLEALLLERDRELRSLKQQFHLHMQHCRRGHPDHSARPSHSLPPEARITKNRVIDRGQDVEGPSAEGSPQREKVIQKGVHCDAIDEVKQIQFESQIDRKEEFFEEKMGPAAATLSASTPFTDPFERKPHQEQGTLLSSRGPVEEIEEEKEVSVDPGHAPLRTRLPEGPEVTNEARVPGSSSSVRENSSWKTDLHALGISYKIKRLKQQLLVLEKLAAAQALKQLPCKDKSSCEKREAGEHKQQLKGFLLVMSLLNKQVKRYQSLEEKADDLCKRMHEIDREGRSRGPCSGGKTKKQTLALEAFLEETFQLQRYIVATGQKLTEIQSRITCTFIGGDEGMGDSPEFNMGRFAAIVRGLFREIQRGLEVRIARIIGNLEGTLACDGILHTKG